MLKIQISSKFREPLLSEALPRGVHISRVVEEILAEHFKNELFEVKK